MKANEKEKRGKRHSLRIGMGTSEERRVIAYNIRCKEALTCSDLIPHRCYGPIRQVPVPSIFITKETSLCFGLIVLPSILSRSLQPNLKTIIDAPRLLSQPWSRPPLAVYTILDRGTELPTSTSTIWTTVAQLRLGQHDMHAPQPLSPITYSSWS